MKVRALIVDDERLARAGLRRLLEARADVEVVGEAANVAEAAKQLTELDPDVVFLDVQMPGGTGFELFDRAQVQAHVVFCTAFDQHAVRAFEVNALDYLLKPVAPEQIDRALRRIPREAKLPELASADTVSLKDKHGLKFTAVHDIVCLTAADDYSEVHLASGKTVLVDVTLRQWEDRLPVTDFARIHRSTLVNLRHVSEIEMADGQWRLKLRGHPSPMLVSRRLLKALREKLEAL